MATTFTDLFCENAERKKKQRRARKKKWVYQITEDTLKRRQNVWKLRIEYKKTSKTVPDIEAAASENEKD